MGGFFYHRQKKDTAFFLSLEDIIEAMSFPYFFLFLFSPVFKISFFSFFFGSFFCYFSDNILEFWKGRAEDKMGLWELWMGYLTSPIAVLCI